MPRKEYRDPNKKTVYVEIDDDTKEDFLDVCHLLDKDQAESFAELVRFYKEAKKVKPRPSRNRK